MGVDRYNDFAKRVKYCEACILTGGCTRKNIYYQDGFCWAEELRKEDSALTKDEIARRHELI